MSNIKGANKQGSLITIRLDDDRKSELKVYAKKYDRKMSDLVREAISVWLNLQTPKGKNNESMVSQSG